MFNVKAKSTQGDAVTTAWIVDRSNYWLRVPTAALRRHKLLTKVSSSSRQNTGSGFTYLGGDDVKLVDEMRRAGVKVNEKPVSTRYSAKSHVCRLPQCQAA